MEQKLKNPINPSTFLDKRLNKVNNSIFHSDPDQAIVSKGRCWVNWLNIAQIFAILWLFSLFFPIRYTFITQTSFKSGLFSDFTSISLYLSDILLIITWWCVLIPRGRTFYHVVEGLKWLILLILLAFLISWFRYPNSYAVFFTFKLLDWIVAYGTIAVLFKETSIKSAFLSFFAVLGTLQGIIALLQFHKNGPVGLFKLGEQYIYPNGSGVAKIFVNNSVFIRAYGTFPHPNVLSAFLVTTVILVIYLFLQAKWMWQKVLLGFSILISIAGLAVAFSRAGYFALAIGLIIFFGYFFWQKIKKRLPAKEWGNVVIVIVIVIVGILSSILIFHKFLLVRITITDAAVTQRGYFNNIGLAMIKSNPILGVGPGDSVLNMQQYTSYRLLPWEYQPIHNYFLLAAAELGIPAVLILIWFFWTNLKSSIFNLKSSRATYYLLLTTLLSIFLVLMFFDHYFYTLQQTQFLLWMFLGIIAADGSSPKRIH